MLNKVQNFLRIFDKQRTAAPPISPADATGSHETGADETSADAGALAIIEITDESAETILHEHDKLVVVDFWAEWCQPCDIMSLYVSMLAKDFSDRIQFAMVDVDENPGLSERFIVRGLPTLLFLQSGIEVDRIVGIMPYEELIQRVETVLVNLVRFGVNTTADNS